MPTPLADIDHSSPVMPWSQDQLLQAARAMAGGSGFAPTLLAVLANAHVDAREVISSIQRAPGIALRVLKVANSAFYGRAGQVDTLERAVQVLGLDAVRAVATAACLDRALPSDGKAQSPSARELLRHSLATAVAAQSLAKLIAPERAADAFLAGLLHDLGYLVVQRLASAGSAARHHALHGECAARVFTVWNLPESLVALARHHHDPAQAPESQRLMVRLVAAAETLAAGAGHGLGAEPVDETIWPLPELDPKADAIVALRADLPAGISALLMALGGGGGRA